ncbi:phosphoenolpyruvate carboxylase [Helicosporidium sp. ATCC 50920]|nr:phosphoenolpyruvate carboxylase [Helicosporidium sp. ATCC 50920]|eukprot:KDD75970.1 phosphoenolpyruvate carboxylase [Helicosporidium sp. ATCC 50920]
MNLNPMPSFAHEVNQAMLKEDDDLLRNTFLSVFCHHHPQLANKVDVIFAMSQAWCMSENDSDFDILVRRLEALQPDEMVLVSSAFSQLLNLHNLTEEIVTARVEKAARLGEVAQSTRSTNKSLQRLVKDLNVAPEAIYEALCKQRVELVFTAHPTQAIRASLLKKYGKIRKEMELLHSGTLTTYEHQECLAEIRAQVAAAWRSDEIRRRQPTPLDESRQGLSYFFDTIYTGLPVFLRRLDSALKNIGQPPLPLSSSVFRFASWTGGDRDGNPNVTPQTTRDVVLATRMAAIELLRPQIVRLAYELSVWRASEPLQRRADAVLTKRAARLRAGEAADGYANFAAEGDPELAAAAPSSDEDEGVTGADRNLGEVPFLKRQEPYRVVLGDLRDRLGRTHALLRSLVSRPRSSVRDALKRARHVVHDQQDLIRDLTLCYESLLATGDEDIARSTLLDALRQAHVFGLHLCALDVRQESAKHAAALDALTQALNLTAYTTWSEQERLDWLYQELANPRPLIPRGFQAQGDVADVLDTLRVLATLPSDSLGAYVVSMTRAASDVLAVLLLQQACGVQPLLRVVPLFETLDDLHAAEGAMRGLWSNAQYRALTGDEAECMIGYSDSGKDAGRLAAAWGLYQVQEQLAAAAQELGVHLTLFHGRGGTVGRGGAPAHLAVLSQPPRTVQGSLRVTVQGEVVEQQFGEQEIAFRTLDLYTSAVLEATLAPTPKPKPEWREVMDWVAARSCAAYRGVVRQDPRFWEYFQALTPVNELGRMNIGSRPASRNPRPTIDSLRAIPWIFAWTQVRLHLPIWLGVGQALDEALQQFSLGHLQEMYNDWAFFRVTLDLLEMVFAKADPRMVRESQKRLVAPELHDLGDMLLTEFQKAEKLVLQVMKRPGLLSSSSTALLQQKLQLRAPYVAPLNILQSACLCALRDADEETARNYQPDRSALALLSRASGRPPLISGIEDTLIITMKGIAAGMQNTG